MPGFTRQPNGLIVGYIDLVDEHTWAPRRGLNFSYSLLTVTYPDGSNPANHERSISDMVSPSQDINHDKIWVTDFGLHDRAPSHRFVDAQATLNL